jgi:hypothetical protein
VAVGALALVTLGLALVFNPTKPVGLTATAPFWTLSRTNAQTLRDLPLEHVFTRIDETVPADCNLGAVLGEGDWSYPLYGPTLKRRVAYLTDGEPFREADKARLRWVVFGKEEPALSGSTEWRLTPLGDRWSLAHRLNR